MTQTVETREMDLPTAIFAQIVLFPGQTVPIGLGPGYGRNAFAQAWKQDKQVLMVFVTRPAIAQYKTGAPPPLPPVGVIAHLQRCVIVTEDEMQVTLAIQSRAELQAISHSAPFYRVRCVPRPDPVACDPAVEALMETVRQRSEAHLLDMQVPGDALTSLYTADTPGQLADFAAYVPVMTEADKLQILATLDPMVRLQYAADVLGRG